MHAQQRKTHGKAARSLHFLFRERQNTPFCRTNASKETLRQGVETCQEASYHIAGKKKRGKCEIFSHFPLFLLHDYHDFGPFSAAGICPGDVLQLSGQILELLLIQIVDPLELRPGVRIPDHL